jgi:hypothetical protein
MKEGRNKNKNKKEDRAPSSCPDTNVIPGSRDELVVETAKCHF